MALSDLEICIETLRYSTGNRTRIQVTCKPYWNQHGYAEEHVDELRPNHLRLRVATPLLELFLGGTFLVVIIPVSVRNCKIDVVGDMDQLVEGICILLILL